MENGKMENGKWKIEKYKMVKWKWKIEKYKMVKWKMEKCRIGNWKIGKWLGQVRSYVGLPKP